MTCTSSSSLNSHSSLFSQSLPLVPHSSFPLSMLYQIVQLDQSTLNPNYSIKSSNWISPLRTLTHHRPNSKSTQTPKVQKPISFNALISLCQSFFFFFRSQVETTKNNLRFLKFSKVVFNFSFSPVWLVRKRRKMREKKLMNHYVKMLRKLT